MSWPSFSPSATSSSSSSDDDRDEMPELPHTGRPMWERLPPRAVHPCELAAAMPYSVPGGKMQVKAVEPVLHGETVPISAFAVLTETGNYHRARLGADGWEYVGSEPDDTPPMKGIAGESATAVNVVVANRPRSEGYTPRQITRDPSRITNYPLEEFVADRRALAGELDAHRLGAAAAKAAAVKREATVGLAAHGAVAEALGSVATAVREDVQEAADALTNSISGVPTVSPSGAGETTGPTATISTEAAEAARKELASMTAEGERPSVYVYSIEFSDELGAPGLEACIRLSADRPIEPPAHPDSAVTVEAKTESMPTWASPQHASSTVRMTLDIQGPMTAVGETLASAFDPEQIEWMRSATDPSEKRLREAYADALDDGRGVAVRHITEMMRDGRYRLEVPESSPSAAVPLAEQSVTEVTSFETETYDLRASRGELREAIEALAEREQAP